MHSVGPDADRLLLIIDRPSEAQGAVSQELGFAGHLVRQLSVLSGHGTDLDIVSNGDMTAAECASALAGLDLARFDAIVLMVGLTEAVSLSSEAQWSTSLTLLLDGIDQQAPHQLHTFIVAIPPVEALIGFPRLFAGIVGPRIRRLNYISRRVCLDRERTSLLTFDIPNAPAGGRNTSTSYAGWAALIAPAIHRELAGGSHWQRADSDVDEASRQAALDAMHVIDTYPSPIIDRLVESARNLFGTSAAAVTFLDHGRRWVKSAIGTGMADSARVGSFCDLAIASPGIFVIEDMQLDRRLAALRTPGEATEFYAGYPLESPTGDRVGVLCIMDDFPRTFSTSESALLRQIALQIQTELWES